MTSIIPTEQVRADQIKEGDAVWVHGQWRTAERIDKGQPFFGKGWMADGYELGTPDDVTLRQAAPSRTDAEQWQFQPHSSQEVLNFTKEDIVRIICFIVLENLPDIYKLDSIEVWIKEAIKSLERMERMSYNE